MAIAPGLSPIRSIMPLFFLSETDMSFPPPWLAGEGGLLAVGGDLTPERLLRAYALGIFPWFNEGDPILWWSPDPRLVLFPDRLHTPRRLLRTMRSGRYTVTADRAFDRVIRACAETPRTGGDGTWITTEMIAAYCRLHAMGHAHSVETWADGDLVGGLYGVSLGASFFGESMFTRMRDASKAAFVTLARQLRAWHFDLIDCQVTTAHLIRLGAEEVSRVEFLGRLRQSLRKPDRSGPWAWTVSPTAG